MGRGLSPLQRTILEVAYENRSSPTGSRGWWPDAFYGEILARHYGWVPVSRQHQTVGGHPSRPILNFSRAAVGVGPYLAAHAALSRAVSRLEARGLVQSADPIWCPWAGISLTRPGVALLESLSAKSPA